MDPGEEPFTPGVGAQPRKKGRAETTACPVADLIPGHAPGGGGKKCLPKFKIARRCKASRSEHHDGGREGQGKARQEGRGKNQPEAVLWYKR